MIKDEIFCYIRDNFNLDYMSASTLVWNIVSLIVDEVGNKDDRISFASDLLEGLGLEDEELTQLFDY